MTKLLLVINFHAATSYRIVNLKVHTAFIEVKENEFIVGGYTAETEKNFYQYTLGVSPSLVSRWREVYSLWGT